MLRNLRHARSPARHIAASARLGAPLVLVLTRIDLVGIPEGCDATVERLGFPSLPVHAVHRVVRLVPKVPQ